MTNSRRWISREILIYLLLKVAGIQLIFLFYPPSEVFRFDDLDTYLSFSGYSPNIAYVWILKIFDLKSLVDWKAVALAIVVSVSRDLLAIRLSSAILISYQFRIFFIFILCFHPYLTIYSVKLTTDLFASFFVTWITYFLWINKKNGFFVFGILIGAFLFRNPLVFFIAGCCFLFWTNGLGRERVLALLTLALLIFLSLWDSYPQGGNFLSANYDFGFTASLSKFDEYSPIFGWPIGFVFYILTQLGFLLGFREAAFTIGVPYFLEIIRQNPKELIVSILLIPVHIFGLFGLFSLFGLKRFLVLMLVVFPAALVVAHLRYFMPLIPSVLLGFVFLSEKIFVTRERE